MVSVGLKVYKRLGSDGLWEYSITYNTISLQSAFLKKEKKKRKTTIADYLTFCTKKKNVSVAKYTGVNSTAHCVLERSEAK